MDDLALGPVRRLVILGELLVLLGEVGEEVLLVGVLVEEGGVVDTDVCREGDVGLVGDGEVLEHEGLVRVRVRARVRG